LAARLAEGALPLAEALRYAIAVAEALREIHLRHRVYGCLQPSGIVVSGDRVRLTPRGPAPVSPYFSPEQVTGSELTARSDIFALGALLYEMLSGRPPFIAPTKPALRIEILDREPAPLENVPPALARVVDKCLEKKPGRRVQRIEILLAELKLLEILAGKPFPPPPEPEAVAAELPLAPVVVAPAPAAVPPVPSKRQPACPACGSRDVHDSRPQGSLESALLRAHVSIHRCHRCYYRFLHLAWVSIRKPDIPGAWLPPVEKTAPGHKPVL